jgi:hypothetical protein
MTSFDTAKTAVLAVSSIITTGKMFDAAKEAAVHFKNNRMEYAQKATKIGAKAMTKIAIKTAAMATPVGIPILVAQGVSSVAAMAESHVQKWAAGVRENHGEKAIQTQMADVTKNAVTSAAWASKTVNKAVDQGVEKFVNVVQFPHSSWKNNSSKEGTTVLQTMSQTAGNVAQAAQNHVQAFFKGLSFSR